MSARSVVVNGIRMSPQSVRNLQRANLHRKAERYWLLNGGKSLFKQQLRKIYGDFCCYCGVRMVFGDRHSEKFATVEHVIPLSRGGGSELSNLALACRQCNTTRPDDALSLPEIVEQGGAA